MDEVEEAANLGHNTFQVQSAQLAQLKDQVFKQLCYVCDRLSQTSLDVCLLGNQLFTSQIAASVEPSAFAAKDITKVVIQVKAAKLSEQSQLTIG